MAEARIFRLDSDRCDVCSADTERPYGYVDSDEIKTTLCSVCLGHVVVGTIIIWLKRDDVQTVSMKPEVRVVTE